LGPRLHPHVGQPRIAEQFRHPAADRRVGAVAAEDHREDRADPVEGMRRIAQRVLGVRLGDRNHAPGLASRTISATTWRVTPIRIGASGPGRRTDIWLR
jgi:hypothetical protein